MPTPSRAYRVGRFRDYRRLAITLITGKAPKPLRVRYSPNLYESIENIAGAMMGMMGVDHPDIFKFIKAKSNLNKKHKRIWGEYTNLSGEDDVLLHKVLADNQLSHFNISVILTDDFMNAVKADGEWNLISRFDGSIKATVRAKEVFRFIAQNAWESGDPGLYFIDRANEDNFLYPEKIISATNPCGEIGLYDYEPCNLAAINLAAFVENGKLDIEQLIYYTKIATRFLDNIHDISENLVPEVNENARAYRRLGLGVMGLADMFLKLGIPYDSEDAVNLSKGLAKLITESAWEASHDLAEEKGIPKALMGIETDNGSIRNISVTTIAPSGTIALIADVNNAIEPIYSFAYRRNITNGIGNQAIDTAIILNQDLDTHLQEHYTESEIEYIKEKLLENGSLQNIEGVKDITKTLFKGASDLTWKTHVDIQAAWQESITNSISKTVNLPNHATVEDIEQVFMYAWEQRVKGITIYRDGSKTFQILGKV